MILSGRILGNVANANNFTYEDAVEFTEGDTLYVFIQLIDTTLDKADQGFKPAGRRYAPAAGSTLSVVINNIDTAKTYTKTATQPFATDASIWRISISSSDAIVGTSDMKLTLTETAVVTRGIIKSGIRAQSQIVSH